MPERALFDTVIKSLALKFLLLLGNVTIVPIPIYLASSHFYIIWFFMSKIFLFCTDGSGCSECSTLFSGA